MRIEVGSRSDSVARDVQIYAEYHVFSVLHRFAPAIELIIVNVNASAGGAETIGADCEIDVRLLDGELLHIGASGPHAAAAIDGAVQRLAGALAVTMDGRHERHLETGVGGHKRGSRAIRRTSSA